MEPCLTTVILIRPPCYILQTLCYYTASLLLHTGPNIGSVTHFLILRTPLIRPTLLIQLTFCVPLMTWLTGIHCIKRTFATIYWSRLETELAWLMHLRVKLILLFSFQVTLTTFITHASGVWCNSLVLQQIKLRRDLMLVKLISLITFFIFWESSYYKGCCLNRMLLSSSFSDNLVATEICVSVYCMWK